MTKISLIRLIFWGKINMKNVECPFKCLYVKICIEMAVRVEFVKLMYFIVH